MTAAEDRRKAQARPDDVIAAVLEDHAQIRELFARVESASGHDEKAEAFRDLTVKLVVHETAEQEVVHPLTRQDDEAVAEARLEEESEGESLLSELEKLDVTSADFDQKLAKLRDDVLEHAESEENQEHPVIDANVDSDRLQTLATAFRAAEKAAPTHPHPHGPTSATGNLVVGPVVAIADRARDAVRAVLGSS